MRRITCRSTLAIASAVALLAVVLVGLGTVGAARAAAATTCTTYHVIGARGSGEPSDGFNSMGPRVGAYAQQAAKAIPAATTVFENLPYPAQPVGPDYFQSMYSGVAMLTSELESLIANCPDTRIGLIGYSQGAQVVHMTLDEFLTSAELGHIDAVLLLADPESAPGMPYVDSPKTDGTAGTHTGGGILAEDSLPVEVSSRSTEVCIQDDPVCDSPGVTALDTAASLAFNGNIHLMYGTCCGSVDFPGIEGNNFALRMLLPLDLNGGASGELNGNIPGPPLVTSVNGLADGTVLVTQDTNRVYKIVGGAPVWLSSCANNLCPNPRATTQAVIDAGPAVPRDGATASDEAGNIFKFAGGAPIHLASCAVGCGTPVPITTWSIVHFDHMRPFPSNGSTIEDESGDIFKFAGLRRRRQPQDHPQPRVMP
jgi:Cutinase